MKKILFVTRIFPAISESFIINLIEQAKTLGNETSVLCNIEKKSNKPNSTLYVMPEPPLNRFKKVQEATFFLVKNPFQFKNFFYSIFKWGGTKSLNNFFALTFFKDLKVHYDIYHVQFGLNAMPLIIARKANLIEGKIITTFHGYDAFPSNQLPFISKKYYNNLFRYGDIFTYNTPYIKKQLLKLGCPEEKLVHLPMTVNISEFNCDKQERTDCFRLISVGRLEPIKGFKYGIQVVSILKNKGLNLKYVIIGEGTEKSKLQNLISSYGLEKEVILAGALSQKEVFNYYNKNNLYLMTSVTDRYGRCESQGVVSIEAQSCGLPVFGFDSGGVKYTIDNFASGRIFPEKDVERMAEEIYLLSKDNNEYRRMSDNAIDFVKKNYSNEVQRKILKKIYKGAN